MKYLILTLSSLFIFIYSLNAAKPLKAGNSNTQEIVDNQTEAQNGASNAKASKEKKEKKSARIKQDEKHKEKAKNTKPSDDADELKQIKNKANNSDKTDAERKEAGKGSETGQQKRVEHSRKWWKFWGEKEEK